METERNWVGAVKHDFAMQFYSNIQMKFWEANPLVLIKIGLIKINQEFEKNLPIVNSLPDENVECEYIHEDKKKKYVHYDNLNPLHLSFSS